MPSCLMCEEGFWDIWVESDTLKKGVACNQKCGRKQACFPLYTTFLGKMFHPVLFCYACMCILKYDVDEVLNESAEG